MPTADQTHASALHREALLQARRPELDAFIAHREALPNGHDDTRVEVAGTMAGAWFAVPLRPVTLTRSSRPACCPGRAG